MSYPGNKTGSIRRGDVSLLVERTKLSALIARQTVTASDFLFNELLECALKESPTCKNVSRISDIASEIENYDHGLAGRAASGVASSEYTAMKERIEALMESDDSSGSGGGGARLGPNRGHPRSTSTVSSPAGASALIAGEIPVNNTARLRDLICSQLEAMESPAYKPSRDTMKAIGQCLQAASDDDPALKLAVAVLMNIEPFGYDATVRVIIQDVVRAKLHELFEAMADYVSEKIDSARVRAGRGTPPLMPGADSRTPSSAASGSLMTRLLAAATALSAEIPSLTLGAASFGRGQFGHDFGSDGYHATSSQLAPVADSLHDASGMFATFRGVLPGMMRFMMNVDVLGDARLSPIAALVRQAMAPSRPTDGALVQQAAGSIEELLKTFFALEIKSMMEDFRTTVVPEAVAAWQEAVLSLGILKLSPAVSLAVEGLSQVSVQDLIALFLRGRELWDQTELGCIERIEESYRTLVEYSGMAVEGNLRSYAARSIQQRSRWFDQLSISGGSINTAFLSGLPIERLHRLASEGEVIVAELPTQEGAAHSVGGANNLAVAPAIIDGMIAEITESRGVVLATSEAGAAHRVGEDNGAIFARVLRAAAQPPTIDGARNDSQASAQFHRSASTPGALGRFPSQGGSNSSSDDSAPDQGGGSINTPTDRTPLLGHAPSGETVLSRRTEETGLSLRISLLVAMLIGCLAGVLSLFKDWGLGPSGGNSTGDDLTSWGPSMSARNHTGSGSGDGVNNGFYAVMAAIVVCVVLLTFIIHKFANTKARRLGAISGGAVAALVAIGLGTSTLYSCVTAEAMHGQLGNGGGDCETPPFNACQVMGNLLKTMWDCGATSWLRGRAFNGTCGAQDFLRMCQEQHSLRLQNEGLKPVRDCDIPDYGQGPATYLSVLFNYLFERLQEAYPNGLPNDCLQYWNNTGR